MWWPTAPIAMTLGLIAVLEYSAQLQGQIKQQSTKGRIHLGVIIAIFLAVNSWNLIYKGIFTLPVDQMITVNGGTQTAPQNLLIIGTLCLVFLLRNFSAGESKPSMISTLTPVALLGLYAAAIYVATDLSGAETADSYSTKKTLLLFSIVLIPLIPIALSTLFQEGKKVEQIFAPSVLLFITALVTTGWSLKGPQISEPPSWGPTLLRVIEQRTGQQIFCSSVIPDRGLPAYICTRFATAIQAREYKIGASWGSLEANPKKDSRIDSRVEYLRTKLINDHNQNDFSVLLSIDETFGVSKDDSWWMNSLPIHEMEKFNVRDSTSSK
jgi:hypothetical protein